LGDLYIEGVSRSLLRSPAATRPPEKSPKRGFLHLLLDEREKRENSAGPLRVSATDREKTNTSLSKRGAAAYLRREKKRKGKRIAYGNERREILNKTRKIDSEKGKKKKRGAVLRHCLFEGGKGAFFL